MCFGSLEGFDRPNQGRFESIRVYSSLLESRLRANGIRTWTWFGGFVEWDLARHETQRSRRRVKVANEVGKFSHIERAVMRSLVGLIGFRLAWLGPSATDFSAWPVARYPSHARPGHVAGAILILIVADLLIVAGLIQGLRPNTPWVSFM